MLKLLLAAGVAALAFTAPAAAKPDHAKGHGNQAKQGQINHQRELSPDYWNSRQGHASSTYWRNGNCPPGLAKKNNGCLPPGIAKRSFNVGDRWNGNYRPWTFDQVPLDWRNQYNLDPMNRYYYRDGYLYSVDPQTRLVESVIQALIH